MSVAPFRPAPRQMADIEDDPSLFPRDALRGAQTALCMFAAEWHGRQDAYWLAEAGLRVTCVDMNGQKLEEMRRVYPTGWEFIAGDAFEFSPAERFDVVTLDPFTGDAMNRCHLLTPRWCSMANRAVIMGSTVAQRVTNVPAGWSVTDVVRRSNWGGGVFWSVVTPC